MRADITAIQVKAVMDMLGDQLADDDDLKLDTLEGETDLFEIVRKLLDRIEMDEGYKASLVSQIQDRNERKARVEKRIDAHRTAITALMECAQLDKLPLAEATLSLRKLSPKVVVTDENALPPEFVRTTTRPDLSAIKAGLESGAAVPGATLSNGGQPSLTIRRR